MSKSLLSISSICAVAALTLALLIVAGDFNTARAQATSSIKCSNGTVTVGTGDSSGTCAKTGTVFTCGEGNPNQAGGGCDAAGKASCGNTSGSGTCTITLTGTGNPPPKVKGVTPGPAGAPAVKQQ